MNEIDEHELDKLEHVYNQNVSILFSHKENLNRILKPLLVGLFANIAKGHICIYVYVFLVIIIIIIIIYHYNHHI